MRKSIAVALVVLCFGCASQRSIHRVQAYREARNRGGDAAASIYVAPDARLWFEKKEGRSESLGGGSGTWAHWDSYFHGRTDMTDWSATGSVVTATAHETNDFYRLLDWEPQPYRMTWWLDDAGLIKEVLITSIPAGKPKSRMNEFKSWAKEHHPDELAYLLPSGKIDPTADRPERFRAILNEWRKDVGLPALDTQ